MVDGFSSIDPKLAKGPQVSAGVYKKIYGGGGGSSRRKSPDPSVTISGDTVFINGKGYSVAPELQSNFIQQRTGGVGSSAQAAIRNAQKLAEERRRLDAIKQQELREAERIRKELLASTQYTQKEKEKLYKEIADYKESVRFQNRLKKGDIQGFSGIGISPSEAARREALIKAGFLKETSSVKDFYSTVDPLTATFFVDRSPTKKEGIDFRDYLRSRGYQEAINRVPSEKLSVIERNKKNILSYVDKLKREKSKARQEQLKNQINKEKTTLISSLKKYGLARANWTKRQVQLFTLGLLYSVASNVSLGKDIITKGPGFVVSTAVASPAFFKRVINEPRAVTKSGFKTSKAIGKALYGEGKVALKLAIAEPGLALGYIAGEVYTFKGLGAGARTVGKSVVKVTKKLKIAGKLSTSAARKVSPLLNKLKPVLVSLSKPPVITNIATGGVGKGGGFIVGKSSKVVGKIKTIPKTKPIKKIKDKARLVKIAKDKAKDKVKIAKARAKIRKEYKKSLVDAKKLRISAGKKGRTLILKDYDYKKALNIIDGLNSTIARTKVYQLVLKQQEIGVYITKTEADRLIQNSIKTLKASSEYKQLVRLAKQDRFTSIKLFKQKKIRSAKYYFNKLSKKINSLNSVKKLKAKISSIKRGIKAGVKKATKPIKSKINKFKSDAQVRKERSLARKIRLKNKNKWNKLWKGTNRYNEVLVELEAQIKTIVKDDIELAFKQLKKKGFKIKPGQQDEAIEKLFKVRLKKWKSSPEYKRLDYLSTVNKPYYLEVKKAGKFEPSLKLFRKGLKKIKNIKTPYTKLRKTLVSKKRKVVKGLKRKAEVRKQRAFIKQTIKYRLEKAKPVREVTFTQLQRTNSVADMNKLVEKFFQDLRRRADTKLTNAQFSKLKNTMKRRMAKAVRKGDKVEINKFGDSIRRLYSEMGKKSNQPNIKIVEEISVPGKRKAVKRFRTIKDFESPSPKGSFVEVKSGDKVLLQEVKQEVRGRARQVSRSKAKIQAVQKKKISIKPLIEYGSYSVSREALKAFQKSGVKSVQGARQSLGALVDSNTKQDIKSLQGLTSVAGVNVNIDTRIKSLLNSKTKTIGSLKQKKVQRGKKKKIIIPKITKGKVKRKIKGKFAGYDVYVKKRNVYVKQNTGPLSLVNAKDTASFVLDKTLARTGKIVPAGKVAKLESVEKKVAGYYKNKSKKFRSYKIKKGKKVSLEMKWIEKRKYFQDTKGERKQATTLRKKAKRKITPTQRRKMLANLKKARAARKKKR